MHPLCRMRISRLTREVLLTLLEGNSPDRTQNLANSITGESNVAVECGIRLWQSNVAVECGIRMWHSTAAVECSIRL
ncbi:hypothetical protein Taro_032577 [Colocasia esculenta]|uniref:Uncharacterized protein n=1 Tax=Colocasia esculenta TaxID=4460 RepID=A0A843W6I7_COLES|nr:hypothetical protein [Colocasia esculenta]